MESVKFRDCFLFDYQIVGGVAKRCLYFPATKLALFSNGEACLLEQCPTAAKTQELVDNFFANHEGTDDEKFIEGIKENLDSQQKKKVTVASDVIDPIQKEMSTRTPQLTQQIKNLFKELANNGF